MQRNSKEMILQIDCYFIISFMNVSNCLIFFKISKHWLQHTIQLSVPKQEKIPKNKHVIQSHILLSHRRAVYKYSRCSLYGMHIWIYNKYKSMHRKQFYPLIFCVMIIKFSYAIDQISIFCNNQFNCCLRQEIDISSGF